MSDKYIPLDDEIYEYWNDGECLRTFNTKESAMRHYKLQASKHPNSLHTVFLVQPKRTAIIQHLP